MYTEAKRAVLDFFLPRFCVVCGLGADFFCEEHRGNIRRIAGRICSCCGLPQVQSTELCNECRAHLPDYDFHRSLFHYDAVMKDLLHAFKYDDAFWVRHVFKNEMQALAADFFDAGQEVVLVPVPLHPHKLRQRGYNQSLLLTQIWQSVVPRAKIDDALERVRDTPSQTGLGRKERLDNMAGAFTLRHGRNLAGKSVVLIDDIHTTGATLSEAARVLKDGGVKQVAALSMAAVVLGE